MLGLWSAVRFVHVLSAMVWVGGQLTITALLLPVVRARLAPDLRGAVMRDVGRRFGVFTVAVFVPVQVATGVAIAWHRGVTWDGLSEPGYGRTLAGKLLAFVLVMLAAAGHGRATRAGNLGLARSLAIASLLGSLAVVLLATALPAT
jgi:uncharacterized membrane protein